jgi:hypothetical protein
LVDPPEQTDPDDIAAVLDFLKTKLSPEQLNQLTEWLGQNYPRGEEMGGNEPSYFPGRPRPGAAMDASVHRLRKTLGRVTVDNTGLQPDPYTQHKRQQKQDRARMALDARPVGSFESRFPRARRIGQV